MDAYASLHSWLVRRTRSYRVLYEQLGREAAAAPPGCDGALVPSSTGEVLDSVGSAAASWTGVDYNAACLEACAARVEGFEGIEADLGAAWPLPLERFGLALSVHALHVLPNPGRVVQGIADSLAPGGLALLATFTRREGIVACLGRVRRDQGWGEAWNLMPWKVLDSAMLATGGDLTFWSPEQFRQQVESAGLVVEEERSVFDGCSTLIIARK